MKRIFALAFLTAAFLAGQSIQISPSPGVISFMCPTGQFFYAFYFGSWKCGAPNTLTGAGGTPGQILWNNAGSQGGFFFGGDLSLVPSTGVSTIVGFQGRAVASTAPTSGQAYLWNAVASQWQPGTVSGSVGGVSGQVLWNNAGGLAGFTFGGDLTVVPITGGATVVGLQGSPVAATTPTTGQSLIWNSVALRWQPGSPPTLAGGTANQILWNNSGSQAGFTASGDFSLIPSTGVGTVKAIQGRAVASTAPTSGQVYQWNAGASQWQPGTVAGSVGGTSGQTLWNSSGVQAGYTASGDLTLVPATGVATVIGWQGRSVANTAPTNGQTQVWNSVASQWQPGNPSAAPGGSNGQIIWNNTGSQAGLTVSGDGALVASTGVLTVTGTHLSAGLPRAQGGLNSASAGTGILRDGTTPAASELSGDTTTSGSNVTTTVATHLTAPLPVNQGGWGTASCTTPPFSADVTGVVDATTALTTCVNSMAAGGANANAFIIIPPGNYVCHGGPIVPTGVMHGMVWIQTGASLSGCAPPTVIPGVLWVKDDTTDDLWVYGSLFLPNVTSMSTQTFEPCDSAGECAAITVNGVAGANEVSPATYSFDPAARPAIGTVNAAGQILQLSGGASTGNVNGGAIAFQTYDAGSSGSVLNTNSTKFAVGPFGACAGPGCAPTTVTMLVNNTVAGTTFVVKAWPSQVASAPLTRILGDSGAELIHVDIHGLTSVAIGNAIASATAIAPVSQITHITGTATINTITVPAGFSSGCVQLIPDGVWNVTAAGNVALASTAVTGKVLTECYDGTSWYPSY